MEDIEKVIKAWEIFRSSNPYQICDGREFRAISEPEYCMGQMIADTIEMLKEQDKLLRKKQKDIDKLCCDIADLKHRFHEKTEIVRCKDCKFIECITRFGDIVCDRDGSPHRPEWFCPVGEPRE